MHLRTIFGFCLLSLQRYSNAAILMPHPLVLPRDVEPNAITVQLKPASEYIPSAVSIYLMICGIIQYADSMQTNTPTIAPREVKIENPAQDGFNFYLGQDLAADVTSAMNANCDKKNFNKPNCLGSVSDLLHRENTGLQARNLASTVALKTGLKALSIFVIFDIAAILIALWAANHAQPKVIAGHFPADHFNQLTASPSATKIVFATATDDANKATAIIPGTGPLPTQVG
jgi:hypothetical protein